MRDSNGHGIHGITRKHTLQDASLRDVWIEGAGIDQHMQASASSGGGWRRCVLARDVLHGPRVLLPMSRGIQ